MKLQSILATFVVASVGICAVAARPLGQGEYSDLAKALIVPQFHPSHLIDVVERQADVKREVEAGLDINVTNDSSVTEDTQATDDWFLTHEY